VFSPIKIVDIVENYRQIRLMRPQLQQLYC